MTSDSNTLSPSKNTLTQQLEEFSGYTTLHGLHFVFGSDGAVRRLVWFVLVLAGLGFCIKQLIVSFDRLRDHESVISKAIIPSRQLTFPAVTICNINMMKKSLIEGKDAQVYMDNLNTLRSIEIHPKKTLDRNFDLKKAVEKYGHTAQDMIRTCNWNGKNCSYLNFTTSFSHRNQQTTTTLRLIYRETVQGKIKQNDELLSGTSSPQCQLFSRFY
ncbi:Acid-sensing ion channel 3 [Exaiptasia diaphana]|nr:Acid-sensing ion channel 3 [Exaiptasia diaphana]